MARLIFNLCRGVPGRESTEKVNGSGAEWCNGSGNGCGNAWGTKVKGKRQKATECRAKKKKNVKKIYKTFATLCDSIMCTEFPTPLTLTRSYFTLRENIRHLNLNLNKKIINDLNFK